MKTIHEYIADGIAKAGSHAALGKELGLSQVQITRCLHGPYAPSAKAARKLAIYLGEKDSVVVIAAESARADDKETKLFWNNLGKFLATTGVITLVLGTGVALNPQNQIVANFATNLNSFSYENVTNQFILC